MSRRNPDRTTLRISLLIICVLCFLGFQEPACRMTQGHTNKKTVAFRLHARCETIVSTFCLLQAVPCHNVRVSFLLSRFRAKTRVISSPSSTRSTDTNFLLCQRLPLFGTITDHILPRAPPPLPVHWAPPLHDLAERDTVFRWCRGTSFACQPLLCTASVSSRPSRTCSGVLLLLLLLVVVVVMIGFRRIRSQQLSD